MTLGKRSAFTLVEMSIATAVLMIALAMAMSGFTYVLRATSQRSIQNELDIDVQKAMERIKYDLRLSSLNQIFFYPAGPGPYTAMSFPMARDDDGDGAVEVDENGKLIWDRTMVYHVWQGEPSQLRLTIFDPRDNTITDVQRQQQIDSVVATGDGSQTINRANAKTRVIFENLFTWKISPKGASYDAYAPALERDMNAVLGSVVLDNGVHDFMFKVIGKNSASSNYRIGVDSLFVSPSSGAREAEDQLPAAEQYGAAPAKVFMPTGSWDANYQLYFPATAIGQYFKLRMANDRWEETNFRRTGSVLENTKVEFDETLPSKDFVVTLGGLGYAWDASVQTANPVASASGHDALRGCAVRVLIRGEDMVGGNWILNDGGNCLVLFRSAYTPSNPGWQLKIREAHIAECASAEEPTPDVLPGTDVKLRFFDGSWSDEVTLANGASAWAYFPASGAYPIEKKKSYVISYLVSGAANQGTAMRWADALNPAIPQCYIIPATNTPVSADLSAAVWSSRPGVVASTNLYAIQYLYTSLPTNGFFESGPYDTHLASPQYSRIDWIADVPAGSSLKMKVRSGSDRVMSDAPAWSNVTAMASPGAIAPGNRRFIEFRAEMTPNSTYWGSLAPRLQNVSLQWPGEKRVVEVGGTFTKGPDYGMFELSVDGEPIKTGVSIDLQIYQDTRGFSGNKRITSALVAEVQPRNSGH